MTRSEWKPGLQHSKGVPLKTFVQFGKSTREFEDRRTLQKKFSVPSGFGASIRQEVSTKAQPSQGIHTSPIDASARARYSQAQIKDLVAYANPRYLEAFQSLGLLSRRDCGKPVKFVAASLSFRPAASGTFTANRLYTTLPGGSAFGPARQFSYLNHYIGGHRPL